MNTQEVLTHVMSDDLLAIQTPEVLLLEDDAELGEDLRQLLELEGHQVTRVSNGAEGLRAVLKKEFHVILCDMVMPHFPGTMFYVAVKQSRPQLCERFIFMTGHRADRKIDQFIRQVKGLMLWKPFPTHELLTAIQQVLRKVQAHDAEQFRASHGHPSVIPMGVPELSMAAC